MEGQLGVSLVPLSDIDDVTSGTPVNSAQREAMQVPAQQKAF
jgi:hypothetical protein